MADLSKVKIGASTYNLKDAAAREAIGDETKGLIKSLADEAAARAAADTTLQTNITNEASARATADSGLDERIKALESKGRYLSTWDATTGLPETYPEVSGDYPKTYAYRSGDYYIVNKVAASGSTNYMPDGASITKQDAASAWVVGKATFSGTTLNLGDQFQYDGTKWTHIASATTVAFANIQGDAEDNTNLKAKLDAKVTEIATGDANGQIKYKNTADGTYTNVDVAGLASLAYKSSAAGKFTPSGSVSQIDATPAGTVALNDFTQTSTEASLTKADYTPAGSVAGTVVPTGTVSVTVKDATSATAITDLAYESYTPAGTIAPTTGGTFDALKSATFQEDSSAGVQIEGSVSKPDVDLTSAPQAVLTGVTAAGTTPSFADGKIGTFTAPEIQSGFYTAGSDASLSTGAVATLTEQSKSKFAKAGVIAHVGDKEKSEDAECLYFEDASTDDAVTDRGTFTSNTLQTLTGGKATVIDTDKFAPGSWVAGTFNAGSMPTFSDGSVNNVTAAALHEAPAFTGNKYAVATSADTALKTVAFTGTAADIKLTGAKYLKQEIDTATFTGNASGDAITASFTGTKVADFQVTGVNYDKATANGATFTGTENKITPTFTGTEGDVSVS